ncbi:MAG TPA: hypothetical protein PKW28_09380 [Turneriella sp.]|nr:hypothetical protein [Turneriella sp.]HNL53087.1 hypothetical protein [Turneriella sp.]
MRNYLLFLLFLLPAGLLAAPAVREPVVEATIDWQNEKILLTAQWQPGQALANQSNAELRQRLREALLKKLSVVVSALWERSKADGAAEPDLSALWSSLRLDTFQVAENRALATMQVALRGRSSLLAHLPIEYGSELQAESGEALPVAYDKRPNVGEHDSSDHEPLLYTGLVIDARHLPYVPSLNVGVFTSTGRQIYGAAFVTRATAVKRGIAGYFASDSAPSALRRAGKRPLKVSAIDLQAAGEHGIVISEEDAAKLLAHSDSTRNMRRARVVIIVNADKLRERY